MEAKKGFKARATNLPMSPTKIRPIADNIRRKPYVEAVAVLEALPNKGARLLKKVIQSAAANALHQNDMLDEFRDKYNLEKQDWRPAKPWYKKEQ